MCVRRRLRSAWASAQSDQSLCCSDESSLSAWRKLESFATHWVHSEDSDQTGQMPRLIWDLAGLTCHFVGFVMRRLNYVFSEGSSKTLQLPKFRRCWTRRPSSEWNSLHSLGETSIWGNKNVWKYCKNLNNCDAENHWCVCSKIYRMCFFLSEDGYKIQEFYNKR